MIQGYAKWRDEESGIVLGPGHFVVVDVEFSPIPWRASLNARRVWQMRLRARTSQQDALLRDAAQVIQVTTGEVLPGLRDILAEAAGEASRGMQVDLIATNAETTRLDQAIETLQSILFGIRVGAFSDDHPAESWRLKEVGVTDSQGKIINDEERFDQDWETFGSHAAWQGATRAFLFPESQLLPTLRPILFEEPPRKFETMFLDLLRYPLAAGSQTPTFVRRKASDYIKTLPGLSSNPLLGDRLSDKQLAERQALCVARMSSANGAHDPAKVADRGTFFYVPLFCALQLERSGEYLAALDWFKTIYAYHLPAGKASSADFPGTSPLPDRRHIYYGLTLGR